jgi:Mg2+ and Co2+ transporter CorA
MEAVRGHLLLTNCLEDELTRPNIELAMKADRLLWLDLEGTDDEVLTLLHEVFKIHPLAVEDVKEFHQRPKIEDYDDFVSIVVYGARGLGEPLTEVHCFYAERFLVSVHRDEVPAVADACHTLGRLHTDRRLVALYRLLDALVDTMFPYLTAMDERIDELQDQIFVDPKESQLTIIATVFLPLSFLTGFFGQNLGWLVNREGSLTAFLVFGIGTEVLAVIALFVMFRRRGWMGRKS